MPWNTDSDTNSGSTASTDGADAGEPFDRRTFLGSVVATAAVSVLPGVAGAMGPGSATTGRGQLREYLRRQRAAKRRTESVWTNLVRRRSVDQPKNGDDGRFGREVNYFASYSKGLPHDEHGEVDPDAYESLVDALATANGGDFDAVPQAGVRPLTNPEAAVSYNTVGLDPNDVYAPAAPAFDSAESAAEMVELYWQALLCDVPFSAYRSDPDVAAAAAELSGLEDFAGPTDAATLFRGTVPGVQTGPYVSQFLYKNFERGVIERTQQFRPLEPTDYMLDFDEWLAVQNGDIPSGGINRSTPNQPSLSDAGIRQDRRRYPITGRDLVTYVGENVSQQPYLNAALIPQNSEPNNPAPENLALAGLEADGPGSAPTETGLPVEPNVPDGFIDYVRTAYQSLLGGILSGSSAEAHPFRGGRKRVSSKRQPTYYSRADSLTLFGNANKE